MSTHTLNKTGEATCMCFLSTIASIPDAPLSRHSGHESTSAAAGGPPSAGSRRRDVRHRLTRTVWARSRRASFGSVRANATASQQSTRSWRPSSSAQHTSGHATQRRLVAAIPVRCPRPGHHGARRSKHGYGCRRSLHQRLLKLTGYAGRGRYARTYIGRVGARGSGDRPMCVARPRRTVAP